MKKLPKKKLVELTKGELSDETSVSIINSYISKLPKDELVKIAHDNYTRVRRIERYLFTPAIIKMPFFIGLFFITSVILNMFLHTDMFIASSFFTIATSIYIGSFILHTIRKSLVSLFKAKNLFALFISYVLFIVSLLFIFSAGYDMIETTGNGYLTYGICSDDFSESMLESDNQKSDNYFYYSAVTFFTVGYGDLCPMGMARSFSLVNAFIGNFVTVVIMVLVISMYMKRNELSESK